MVSAVRLLVSIGVPLLVGAVGGLATTTGVREWYPSLAKPAFTPPSWLFGPVWTVLYVLMGVAFFLVWRGGHSSRAARSAAALFGLQLLLNALWSPLFFGLRMPGLALLDILLLDAALLATVLAFFRVSSPAAWLLVPYGLWSAFASVLNFEIWRLNA